MDPSAVLTECHRLALAVAPELSGQPLYVLPASAATVPPRGSCLGWTPTNDWIDYALRQKLIDAGRWQGRGVTVFLDLPTIADSADGRNVHGVVRRVLLHELAHVLPLKPPTPLIEVQQPSAAFLHLQRSCLEQLAALPDVGPEQPPWTDDDTHGWRFIRRAVHLWWRAAWQAEFVPLSELAAGWGYSLSPVERYAAYLDDEPHRLRTASFAEIEAEPAPRRFMDLWRDDTHFYERMKNERSN